MIGTHDQAVDEIMTMLKDAWEGDVSTSPIPILWAEVATGRPGDTAASGDPEQYLRVELLHEGGSKQTLQTSSVKKSRHQYTGTLMAHLHVPSGKGSIHALPLLSVAGQAFTNKSSPGGVWFRSPQYTSIGRQGSWYVMAMTTTFLYDLFE